MTFNWCSYRHASGFSPQFLRRCIPMPVADWRPAGASTLYDIPMLFGSFCLKLANPHVGCWWKQVTQNIPSTETTWEGNTVNRLKQTARKTYHKKTQQSSNSLYRHRCSQFFGLRVPKSPVAYQTHMRIPSHYTSWLIGFPTMGYLLSSVN